MCRDTWTAKPCPKQMLDFLFGRKKKRPDDEPMPPYFEGIGADLHSHLIPGIDDGAPDLATSLAMAKRMRDMGIRRIATTPHISELYPNDHDSIFDGLIRLKQLLRFEGIDVEVSAAAEYMINDLFEQHVLRGDPLLTLPNRHILVEMPQVSEPMNLRRVLALLKSRGFTPIMAHPERYRFYNRGLFHFEGLREYGCLFQVNALSLVGYYGSSVSEAAWNLMNNRLIDFIGTDFHHEQHIKTFHRQMTPACQQALLVYPFKNRELFAGEMPQAAPAVPPVKVRS